MSSTSTMNASIDTRTFDKIDGRLELSYWALFVGDMTSRTATSSLGSISSMMSKMGSGGLSR